MKAQLQQTVIPDIKILPELNWVEVSEVRKARTRLKNTQTKSQQNETEARIEKADVPVDNTAKRSLV
jgi:hypothetical protein